MFGQQYNITKTLNKHVRKTIPIELLINIITETANISLIDLQRLNKKVMENITTSKQLEKYLYNYAKNLLNSSSIINTFVGEKFKKMIISIMDAKRISGLEGRILELENINSALQKRILELETKVIVLEEQLKTSDLFLETLVLKYDSGCTFDSMGETIINIKKYLRFRKTDTVSSFELPGTSGTSIGHGDTPMQPSKDFICSLCKQKFDGYVKLIVHNKIKHG